MNLRCFSAFYLSAVAFLPSAVGESPACVDDPVDWVSDTDVVYDCAYLDAQPGNCLVLGEGTDGKTATQACCACGGGIEPENPKQCNDEPRWYILNSNGVEKDCDWFADDGDYRCEKHGHKEGRFSMSANEACCACGGGDEPVTSPPSDPPKICDDEEDWFILNNKGKEKDCDWFADDADYRCEKHGHKEGEFDLSADQACCACGGGDLPRQCTDETIGDDEDWFVSHHNGKDYDCDWFAKDQDSRCEQHGNRVGAEDMTADQACCACGGGSDSPKLCDSKSDWFVTNNGKEYDCEWFGKNDERCDKHGNRRGEFGLTAEEACCECGGGSTIG